MCHHLRSDLDVEAMSDAEREELLAEHDDELEALNVDREELAA